MRLLVLLLLLALTAGCGRTRLVNPPTPTDASADGSSRRDAASDGGFDASFDGGFDGGPGDPGPLADVLTCGIDETEVLMAASRWVDCNRRNPATVRTVVEAWEGFVLGSLETFAPSLANLPVGCDTWQCAADATSCRTLRDCISDSVLAEGPCADTEYECFGDVLGVCRDGAFRRQIDCGEFEVPCSDGACRIGRCAFGGRAEPPACVEGGIEVCGLTFRLECDEWSPGSSCASFFVQGEIPTLWCSPTGMGEAGAYSTPVDCNARSGRVSFTSVTGREWEIDCVELGFSGCDERGCVR